MGVVDQVLARKKLLGLVLLAVGVLLVLTGQTDQAFQILGVGSVMLAYIFIIAGIVLLVVRLSKRRGHG